MFNLQSLTSFLRKHLKRNTHPFEQIREAVDPSRSPYPPQPDVFISHQTLPFSASTIRFLKSQPNAFGALDPAYLPSSHSYGSTSTRKLIPTNTCSHEALEFLGFTPDAALTLYELYVTRSRGFENEDCLAIFIGTVRRHVRIHLAGEGQGVLKGLEVAGFNVQFREVLMWPKLEALEEQNSIVLKYALDVVDCRWEVLRIEILGRERGKGRGGAGERGVEEERYWLIVRGRRIGFDEMPFFHNIQP